MKKLIPDACQRVILSTAVGDSVGLPAEGMSRKAIARRWPGPWKQRLVFGKGMVSDDTEHTVFVAQCLIQHGDDVEKFQRALAWKLRWWLLCIPAGIGFATLRACLKLWIGFPPKYSGVFSAGNGPAMRSAIIGAYFAGNPEKITAFVRASTRLTHTDPKAETGALAVALTTSWLVETGGKQAPDTSVIQLWRNISLADSEWQKWIDTIEKGIAEGWLVDQFAVENGLEKGVTGYVYHTVPVVLYVWWKHFGDYRATVDAVIRCGGDTDTTGAIVGDLAALSGKIPKDWLENLWDAPLSSSFLDELGQQADASSLGTKTTSSYFRWWLLPFRNLLFLMVVLIHGFSRLISTMTTEIF